MDIAKEIYPGGFHSLMRHLERKQTPFKNVDTLLDSIGTDLDALAGRIVPPVGAVSLPAEKHLAETKWNALRAEFSGRSELELVHAITIAILRRREPSARARDLFLQIWRERGEQFVHSLDSRWMISAATTFGDHGETEAQRRGGQGLSMLFDLIKLHDSERRLSGRPGHFAFPKLKRRNSDHPLAFDLTPYSLQTGDLDRNMLARLWQCAEADSVFQPLGMRMLKLVMTDNRSIFSRLQHYKKQQQTK